MRNKRPTFKELYYKYLDNSSCIFDYDDSKNALVITFKGELVRTPSLKNNKMPGMNFICADTRARLEAMDYHFNQALIASRVSIKTISNAPLLLIYIAGKRSRSFDLSGCIEAIQDWLEPHDKKVGKKSKSRGWGIGLIENDNLIRPQAYHWFDLPHFNSDETKIILMRLEDYLRDPSQILKFNIQQRDCYEKDAR